MLKYLGKSLMVLFSALAIVSTLGVYGQGMTWETTFEQAEKAHAKGSYKEEENLLFCTLVQTQWAGIPDAMPSAATTTLPPDESIPVNAVPARQMAMIMEELAEVSVELEEYTQAEMCYRSAYDSYSKDGGPKDPRSIQPLLGLASTLVRDRRFDDATILYKRALALAEDAYGPGSSTEVEIETAMGQAQVAQGNLAGAEETLSKALPTSATIGTTIYPVVMTCIEALANTQDLRGELIDEEATWTLGVTITKQVWGKEHENMSRPLVGLGRFLANSGKPADAEHTYNEAITIVENALGPDALLLADPLSAMGDLLLKQGRTTETETMYRKTLAIQEKQLGIQHPETAETRESLGCTLMVLGKVTEAEQCYTACVAALELDYGSDNPKLRDPLEALAAIYRQENRDQDAISIDQRLQALRQG